jgi:F-type H+-transporting ATPase subunit gamma
MDPLKAEDTANQPQLIAVCSSDRGLCGSIHSSLSKAAKKIIRDEEKASSPTSQIVIIGDKAKPQVAREARQHIVASFSQVAKGLLGISEVTAVSDKIARVDESTSEERWIRILYNRFQSVISYVMDSLYLPPVKCIRDSKAIAMYAEEEPMSEELLTNYREFALASSLYWALTEGHASEMASRRMAMDNATKNSENIVQELTMRYNRTRQAVITNELVDIITGASAL